MLSCLNVLANSAALSKVPKDTKPFLKSVHLKAGLKKNRALLNVAPFACGLK